MRYISLIVLSLLFAAHLGAQEKPNETKFSVSLDTYLSSGDELPFWLTANKNGVFSSVSDNYQLNQASFAKELSTNSSANWEPTWGANMVYGYGEKANFQANQYWIGLRYKWLVLNAGAKANPIVYGGLSSTNGNIDYSNNARPLPGLLISTNDFIPFPIGKSWFSFKAQYEEKFYSDHAYVKDAHFHHKALFGKAKFAKKWSLTLGIDHYVMWGGTSPTEGAMPGIKEYFNYILGLKGGSEATASDQINVAGNQLGNYSMTLKKEWTSSDITFYWNHLFEDHSGMEFANIQDGLWGLHIHRKNESALITDIVYEYMSTLNQSGTYHLIPAPTPENPDRITGRGRDNYFNHGTYQAFTYYNQIIATPLFVPSLKADSKGNYYNYVESTRMWMHHLGLKGNLGSGFYWKSMFTWSRNFGRYIDDPANAVNPRFGVTSYTKPLNEFSFLCELNYRGDKLPFELNAGIAGDQGDRFDNRIGGYAGVCYKF